MRTIIINVLDSEYEVKPNFGVIERIESRFTLLQFLREAGSNPRISNIAWVIYSALKEAGEDVKYGDVGNWVAVNIADANLAATDIASSCIGGGPENESKKKKKTAETGQE